MKNNYLLRSLMFVPGHNEKLLTKASTTDADVLLFDVEDSVQPQKNKQKARDLIVDKIKSNLYSNYHVFPRINDRESGELLKDLIQLTIEGVDGFMYPKAAKREDIYFIDKLLETIEFEKGFEIGRFKLIPLIETAGGVLNAQEIAKASDRTVAIAFGSEDYITDIGGIHDLEEDSIFFPRNMVVLAARSAGVVPVDTVHIRVHDLEHLEKNLKISKMLGFEGMLVLNPKELPLVHEYFSPSKKQVDDSVQMLKAADEAAKEGVGVAIVNGKFVGPPMVKAANKILDKHNKIKSKKK